MAADSLWAFDDAFTSVAHGFADAADYYYRSSCIRLLHRIGVPTLLLSARNDPFHPRDLLNDVARIAAQNPSLHLEITEHGGHVGFVEGEQPRRARYYAERRVVAFASHQLARFRD
jgi:predicted alpha/beta-fold hydrolase